MATQMTPKINLKKLRALASAATDEPTIYGEFNSELAGDRVRSRVKLDHLLDPDTLLALLDYIEKANGSLRIYAALKSELIYAPTGMSKEEQISWLVQHPEYAVKADGGDDARATLAEWKERFK